MKFSLLITLNLAIGFASCNVDGKNDQNKTENKKNESKSNLQISLAQWSLHKTFFGSETTRNWEWFGKMLRESPDSVLKGTSDPINFPSIAASYGLKSIELVNTFYFGKADDWAYWTQFNQNCKTAAVTVGLIMCDQLGNLADSDSLSRQIAVENHYKWVDVCKFIGAQAIRVNAAGEGTAAEVAEHAVLGLKMLGDYAAKKGINVLVENHGGYSSDGAWLADVMTRVAMENVGTLPDFGNFCLEYGPDGCVKAYDRYKGTEELMPFAKGVSAKSKKFDSEGNEVDIDFYRLLKIVKTAGYAGFIGVEYEGEELSEDEGIKATINLLQKAINEN